MSSTPALNIGGETWQVASYETSSTIIPLNYNSKNLCNVYLHEWAWEISNRSGTGTAGNGGMVFVCQKSGSYVDDRCWDRRDERYANRFEGLKSAPAGTKIGGVE